MTKTKLSAVEIVNALEAHRVRGIDATARKIASGISHRLALYNEAPSAGNYGAELDRAETFVREYGTNPVVRETPVRVAPGWVVREYADGMFSAIETNGIGVGPGETSFADAVYFAKHGKPTIR